MSEISADGILLPLHASPNALAAGRTSFEAQPPPSDVVEQAKRAVSARLATTPEVALEMMRGLARSQHRSLREYAAEIVANGGRLDGIS